MAKLEIVKATTSKLLRIFIQDSSVGTGAGLASLVFNSAGLNAYYIREGESNETAITLATMTLGTWATGGFIAVDNTNMPGLYEIGIPDAVLATGAGSAVVMLKGATNMVPCIIEVQLVDPVISPVTMWLGLLKQSTNVHVLVGPFINRETGAPLTSLTLGNITAARVTQTGSTITRTAMTLAASGTNQFTSVGDGYWELDISTTDTGTLGRVAYTFRDDDVFHPVVAVAQVVIANVWEGLVAQTSSATLKVDVRSWGGAGEATGEAMAAYDSGALIYPIVDVSSIAQDTAAASALFSAIDQSNNLVKTDIIRISGDATAADNLESYTDGTDRIPVDVREIDNTGTTAGVKALQKALAAVEASSGTLFTVTTAVFTPTTVAFRVSTGDATDDHYNNSYIRWTAGALLGQITQCTDYTGSTLQFTVTAMTEAPANGDTFVLL